MNLITTPNAHGDGITCVGPDSMSLADENVFKGKHIIIEDRIVDDINGLFDGGIDCVDGADVLIRRCVVRNVGKAMLCGNEYGPALVTIEDSIIENFCRRGPEAQNVASVIMYRCLIRNWGHPSRFDMRCFGAWAHHGGRIHADSCVFLQDSFFNGRFWADLIGHIGQAWNDRPSRLRDYLLPGVCRGLTAGPGGKVSAVNCYRNSPLIQIEGHKGPWMPKEEALELIERLEG